MTCDKHDWQSNGARHTHAYAGNEDNPARLPVICIYLRCIKCKQVGFRRGDSPVIYTWDQIATKQ